MAIFVRTELMTMDWINLYIEQLESLKKYVREHPSDDGVSIEYIEAYGTYPCLIVKLPPFSFDMEFRPQEDASRNEIRTRSYFWFKGRYGYEQTRSFAMKRKIVPNGLEVFAKFRRDFHYVPATMSTWADTMIRTVDFVRDNPGRFLKLCRSSAPFNEDGSHKFSSWTNYASIRVGYKENTEIIQGVKGGARPSGGHTVGSDGSFRAFYPRTYGIWYTVECIAGEMPRRGEEQFAGEDAYLRQLLDRLGREKMPYAMLNSKLPKRLEVITFDMNEDPGNRSFVPVQYEGSWLKLLQECFKDL